MSKLNILCLYSDCGPSFVRTGWGNVFTHLGHSFSFWDQRTKPAHDVFAEASPDFFLGTTYDLDEATCECIRQRPDMKVALFCSAWGELVDDLEEDLFPITRVKLGEQRSITRLYEQTGKPDFVFSHVPDPWLEGILGGWRQTGVRPVGILNGADTFRYGPGTSREYMRADLGFIGGFWDYKSRNLAPYILPLCHPSSGLVVKIWGNQPWPVAQYLGLIADQDVPDVYASATVCPNISEPHSTEPSLGHDIVERLFKVPICDGFVVSDRVRAIDHVFGPGVVPQASTPGEFHDMVRHYVRFPDERLPIIEQMKKIVLGGHTYFHRVRDLLENAGLGEEARECMSFWEKKNAFHLDQQS